MKVSIISVSLNNESTIKQTIESVYQQTFRYLEYIIVDGGSTDGTLTIIKEYAKKFSGRLKWISEKDKGISDAFNKGIYLSTGDFLYFLGADDYLLSDDSIQKVMKEADPEKDMLICGRIRRVNKDGKNVLWTAPRSLKFNKASLLFRMSLPHQGLFTNKRFFDLWGKFDLNNKYCMDYELLLRAYKDLPEVKIKDIEIAAWRAGGIGKDRILDVLKEYKDIKIKNKVAPVVIIYLIYFYSILKYNLKNVLYR